MKKYEKIAASAALALLIGVAVSTVATVAYAETAVVQMKFDEDSGDLYFDPAKVIINQGDTVVWLQVDADNEHNVAAYPSLIPEGTQPFESQMMTRVGESWSMTFDKVGSYFYHCHPHEAAGMKGLIVVGRESLPEEFRKPKAGDMSHDHGDGGHGDMDEMDHGDMDEMKHGDMDEMKHGDMDEMKHGDHQGDHHGDKKEMKTKNGHHGDDDDENDDHHGHHD
jgi:plastocyanin